MKVWRITRRPWAANPLGGEGSARSGNRWNSRGVRVAYASSGRALAVLEMLVHVTRETVPPDIVLIPIEIPDEAVSEAETVPDGWNAWPHTEASRGLGDRWVKSASSVALLVPSAVLRAEKNILINPAHPVFGRVKVHAPEEDFLDPRLFGLG